MLCFWFRQDNSHCLARINYWLTYFYTTPRYARQDNLNCLARITNCLPENYISLFVPLRQFRVFVLADFIISITCLYTHLLIWVFKFCQKLAGFLFFKFISLLGLCFCSDYSRTSAEISSKRTDLVCSCLICDSIFKLLVVTFSL